MSIEALQFIAPGAGIEQLISPQPTHNDASFVGWLEKELSVVNDQIMHSDTKLKQLASGESTNLHQVMMELEKSKTSFQLVLEIRNKLLDAYQEVMKMQV